MASRGHIRRHGNRWEVIVSNGRDPVTGKRRQLSQRVQGTRDDAELVLAELIIKASRNEAPKKGGPRTVGTFLQEWWDVSSPSWSPATVRNDVYRLKRLKAELGDIPLVALDTATLDRFYARMRASGGRNGGELAATTVGRMHNMLRSALARAVRWGYLSSNPTTLADVGVDGDDDEDERVPPTPQEALALMAAAAEKDTDLAVFIRLAAATGARRGELCALRWTDVDLDAGTVRIARGIVDAGAGRLVEKSVKGKKGSRKRARLIDIDDGTVEELRAHWLISAERALALGIRLTPQAHLFWARNERWRGKGTFRGRVIDPVNGPWRPDNVTHRFIKIRDALELPHVRPHDLRHAVATWLLDEGVSIPTVSKRLGHSRQSTTTDHYAHTVDGRDRKAAEAIGRLLERKPKPESEVG